MRLGERFSIQEAWERYGLPAPQRVEEYPDKGELPAEWFIVYSGLVARVEDALDRLGVHHYYPRMKVRLPVRRTRRYANPTSIVKETPMFPCYLFVGAGRGVDPKDVDGVMDVLRISDLRYARVPHELIARLQAMVAKGKFDKAKKLREVFPPGSAVRVCDGPFSGFHGKVEKALGGEQARILVEIFGRVTPVNLDLTQVEAA